jgi:hypothetical protein
MRAKRMRSPMCSSFTPARNEIPPFRTQGIRLYYIIQDISRKNSISNNLRAHLRRNKHYRMKVKYNIIMQAAPFPARPEDLTD